MEENQIEVAMSQGDVAIDCYLENVSTDQFKKHILDLKKKYSNKEIIKQAINKLEELL